MDELLKMLLGYANDDYEDDDVDECDESCDCDKDCDSAEECFKEFCDSHDDCFNCELFDICSKAVLGHKFTIADEIEEVRFNGPATIVFWKDHTKTVSVCDEADIYDPEKGLAMWILKKLLGDSSYNEAFKQFIPDEIYEDELDEADDAIAEAFTVVEELLETKKLTDRQKEAIMYLLNIA